MQTPLAGEIFSTLSLQYRFPLRLEIHKEDMFCRRGMRLFERAKLWLGFGFQTIHPPTCKAEHYDGK